MRAHNEQIIDVFMLKKIVRITAKTVLFVALLSLVPVLIFRWVPAPGSMLMLERWYVARQNQQELHIEYQWRPYERIPDNLKLAVIASEDQRFATHFGFDYAQIRAAYEHNKLGGTLRGGSSISQQVAKNLFLWPDRTYFRKTIEAWFTLGIELLWPKQRILEMYLNIVEWDHGVFGIDAATRHHFNIDACNVSDRQASQLIAVLPSPLRWDPVQPPLYAQERAIWIRDQMRRLERREYLDKFEVELIETPHSRMACQRC